MADWREIAGVKPRSDWRKIAGVASPEAPELLQRKPDELRPTSVQMGGSAPETNWSPGDPLKVEPREDKSMAVDIGDKIASVGRRVMQAGTFGSGDEAVAGMSQIPVVGKYLNTPIGDLIQGKVAKDQGYKEALENERGDIKQSFKNNPTLSTATDFAVGAKLPIPGLGAGGSAAAKIAKMIGMGSAMGGASALGDSEADIIGGDFAEAAKDTAKGAITGGLAAGALGSLGALAGRAGKYFGGVKDRAVADSAAKSIADQAKKEASALGSYRSGIQSASRDLEVIQREADAGDEAAQAFLSSPKAADLRKMVLGTKLNTAPERISEMERLREEYDALRKAAPENISRRQAEILDPTNEKSKWSKFLINRGAQIMLPMLGLQTGGLPGAAVGSAASLLIGGPGTKLMNSVKAPAARNFVGKWGEKFSAWEPVLSAAAAKGGLALEQAREALKRSDPQFKAMMDEAESLKGEGPLKAHFGGE